MLGQVELSEAAGGRTPGLLALRETGGAKEASVYLVMEPIRSNLSIESMAAILWFGAGMDYREGSVFLFCSRTRTSIYALRFREHGFDLLERKREQGRFHWPQPQGRNGTGANLRGFETGKKRPKAGHRIIRKPLKFQWFLI